MAYLSAGVITFFSDILGMKRVTVKFVPKLYILYMSIAQELLSDVNDDPDMLELSYLVMNHGYMVTTLKPNRLNGSSSERRYRKRHAKFNQK